jgi:tripartite-type tricarboxylate transporter receptor subunit TctC
MFGVIAPAATPRPVVRRIQADIAKALQTPEMRKLLADGGMEPVGSTPEQFDAYIAGEVARWAKVIKDNKIAVGD